MALNSGVIANDMEIKVTQLELCSWIGPYVCEPEHWLLFS
jgi:hypothetical protein